MNNFDTPLNRRNTNTWKWDGEGFGVDFPMGTADTDFKMPIEVQKALQDHGLTPQPSTRQELAEFIQKEYVQWGEVVKQGNLQGN
mgnify:CR=1 FL=1